MFCSFSGPPRIVRLHGRGHVHRPGDKEFDAIGSRFEGLEGVGVRSIVDVEVSRIADSCGYGVPFMDFRSHRPTMDQWSLRKGQEGIRDYQETRNRESLDGLSALEISDRSD
jgi:hypothetical protein